MKPHPSQEILDLSFKQIYSKWAELDLKSKSLAIDFSRTSTK
jgi:hypothetical protein